MTTPAATADPAETKKLSLQEDDDEVASIDRPMNSSANRKGTELDVPTNPGDIIARLTLSENGASAPTAERGDAADNTLSAHASASTANSLEPQSPNPRNDDPNQKVTPPTRHGQGEPAVEASVALSAFQTAATATTTTKQSLFSRSESVQDDELVEEDEDDDEEESSEISASDEDGSWITWFCSLRGNEFFCEVDEDYIQDDFNLTGLNLLVPYYDYALDMVLDVEMPMEDSLTEEQQEIVESAAEMLYGLIHARYIVTNRGMHSMYEKYRTASFGRCPQVFCQGQPVLPVGLSDLPRNYTVNVFCPRCHGLFFPKSTRQANIDGAYFGSTFPHLYLMTHPDMVPAKPTQSYVPRAYGFKIHSSSLYYRNHEEGTQHPQIETSLRTQRKTKRVGRK